MITPNEILFLHIVKAMDVEQIAFNCNLRIKDVEKIINAMRNSPEAEKFARWKNIKTTPIEHHPKNKIDKNLFGDGYSSFPERLLKAGVGSARIELSNKNYRDAAR